MPPIPLCWNRGHFFSTFSERNNLSFHILTNDGCRVLLFDFERLCFFCGFRDRHSLHLFGNLTNLLRHGAHYMKRMMLLLFTFSLISSADAQPKIIRTEKIPLDKSKQWSNPQFSPDGKSIFFTTVDFQGIWQYSLSTKSKKLITADPRSGYGFVVSPNGKSIAYRRTLNETGVRRQQEIVVQDLAAGNVEILSSGDNLSTPTFIGSSVVYSENVTTKNLPSGTVQPVILGIENTKIVLVVDGTKRLLDPLTGGSYIWPVLSPDAKKVVASDMAKGTFVCTLRGSVLARLGKRNAAVWTRNSKWLIYMKDNDDGHNITSSDLFCVSPNGNISRQLTFSKNAIELYPQCSPVENKIVCNTLDGEILVLTYAEAKR